MEEDYIDFDDVLPMAGEFGRYQWLLFLAQAPFCFNLVFVYFMQFFITLEPIHWCMVPDLVEANISVDIRRNMSIPYISDSDGVMTRSKCKMYDVDYKQLIQDGIFTPDESWPIKDCNQWEYDYSNTGHYETIVSELDWVCSKQWYSTLAQSVFFLGAIFGGIISGWAADRYGRVPILVATNFIACLASNLTAMAWTLPGFLIYRFLMGLAFDNIFIMMYVLVIEYVGPKHRTLVANLSIALFYTAGTVLLPWIMIWIGNWRNASIYSSIPMLLGCISYWVLPESARWLLSKGRIEETTKILKKIAKINSKTIPDQVFNDMKKSAINYNETPEGTQNQHDASIFDLFRTPRLRRNTIAICILWMLLTLVYDGHVRNVLNLPGNVFVSFTVASATELPADIMVVLFLDRWGRRWFTFSTLVISGILSILTTSVANNAIGVAVFAVLGRFCVNIAFNIGLQYASEVMPTVVRAQSVAWVHIMGYVAGLLSPLVVYIGHISPLVPLVILGVASIVAGVVGLLLPETLNRDLPQTMEDGENFGKDQIFCDLPCIRDHLKEPTIAPLRIGMFGDQPSFIRHKPRQRPSIRGETYRSSLIKHRRDVIYIPSAD